MQVFKLLIIRLCMYLITDIVKNCFSLTLLRMDFIEKKENRQNHSLMHDVLRLHFYMSTQDASISKLPFVVIVS